MYNFSIILSIIIVTSINSYSQFTNLGVKFGVLYGGPIPYENLYDFSGTPRIGPVINFFANYQVNNYWSFCPQLTLNLRGLDYTGFLRRDTTVTTTIGGTTGQITTFYKAFINGDISLLYLDLPLVFIYNMNSTTKLSIGFQGSMLLGGNDKGVARIVIGEGGFYEDSLHKFNNYSNIRKYDFSLCAGASFYIMNNVNLEFLATRSLMSYYMNNVAQVADIKNFDMYNTFFYAMLSYTFE